MVLNLKALASRSLSLIAPLAFLLVSGCERDTWLRVYPSHRSVAVTGSETSDITAITDRVAEQFGMRRVTELELRQAFAKQYSYLRLTKADYQRYLKSDLAPIARYQVNYRPYLFPKIVRSFYLDVGTWDHTGWIDIATDAPQEDQILHVLQTALTNRFGLIRVRKMVYYPMEF